MKNLKRLIAALLMLCMALSLCACGGDAEPETTAAPTEAEATEVVQPTEAEETEAPVDDGTVTYTVTVQDEEGNPVVGAMVQICLDTCYPSVTDADGIAKYAVAEADYKVSFLSVPAGYEYADETTEWYFADGSTEITITLKAAA